VALVFPIFMLMTTMSNGGLGSGVASAIARAIGRAASRTPTLWCSIPWCWRSSPAPCSRRHPVGGLALYSALGGRGESLAAALQYSNYLFAGSSRCGS